MSSVWLLLVKYREGDNDQYSWFPLKQDDHDAGSARAMRHKFEWKHRQIACFVS